MSLGEMIRSSRDERGMTQGELASLAGVRRAHIALLESGGRLPSAPTLHRVAEALKWPSDARAAALALCDQQR